jgi:uronate dehydrogenase
LRATLRERYQLRLSDIRPVDNLGENEEFVAADVSDLDAVMAISKGVDGIIHMGGVSTENTWESILHGNIVGAYNIYESARKNGVPRVIFPSSNHAVGFYPRTRKIPVEVNIRPDSRYGVSKAFGEAMGSLYADKYGLRVLCLRIGNVAEKPVDNRRMSIWISPRDLTQLISIGLEHPDLSFAIMYGVSGNTRSFYRDEIAAKFGYQPQDNSEDYADEIKAKAVAADPDAVSEQVMGGDFAVIEKGGGAPAVKSPG